MHFFVQSCAHAALAINGLKRKDCVYFCVLKPRGTDVYLGDHFSTGDDSTGDMLRHHGPEK